MIPLKFQGPVYSVFLMFITFKQTATRTAIHHSTKVSFHNEMNCCPPYNMIDDL